MNTRPPSNATAIQSLKDQNWSVKIQHYRRVPTLPKKDIKKDIGKVGVKFNIKTMPDYEWRSSYFHYQPLENGGATEINLVRGEEKIIVRADCYAKDRFCRRLGVSAVLGKLENLYGIK